MKEVFAEIITIGDEILYGQITDTNSQWISIELDKAGIKTKRKTSVGDQEHEIISALKEAEERADIILITGGLGPTKDDITKNTLCKYFDSKLVWNNDALADLEVFMHKRGVALSELNKKQALLPDRCQIVRNHVGTAPGMWFEKPNKVFVSMPGVPFEMKAMVTRDVIPWLRAKFKTPFIYHKFIKTSGIAESVLSERISEWEDALPAHIKLAYLPSLHGVRLRLTGLGKEEDQLKTDVLVESDKVKKIIEEYIYGYDEDTLEVVIGEQLRKQKLTLSAAESCTGGNISSIITKIAGCSDYFLGSVIAYANSIKTNVLGVKPETLEQFGAVSEQTVLEMAEGVRKVTGSDIGVSTSGIAGPGGGTAEKPVGTVWIAYSDKNGSFAKKLNLGSSRENNITLASVAVLNMIRQSLAKKD